MVDGVRKLITARVQPGYVDCEPQGRLPGCLFRFDDVDAQCSNGRKGEGRGGGGCGQSSLCPGDLCGECEDGRGVTLDLQSCSTTSCIAGLILFIFLCE